ncbi:MAG: aminotransferase class III-fold pyridoxal phosphate-dependent enzyme [Algicola sp.]|nr:aminotransferase class III-fold pyridoxal phosphate-dependent enzyme [Algicola sp.]
MTDTSVFSDEQINQLLSQHYQLKGSLMTLPGYCDQNARLTVNNSHDKNPADQQYIVKISNSDEPLIALQMQNAVMAHLKSKEAAVPYALNNTNGQSITELPAPNGKTSYLRVLSYLPGSFYADAKPETHNQQLWHNLGEFMGGLNVALADFEHPGAYRYLDWDLAQGYRVCMSKKHLLDAAQLTLVEHFLDLYKTQTLPLLGDLRQGVIHNDANDYNLLINDVDKPSFITGVIDFGDVVHSHIINELAITGAYALMGQDDPVETLKHLVAGYHQVKPLNDAEIEVLLNLIGLRLCVSVCNSTMAYRQQPDNEYLLVSAKPAWVLLGKLSKLNGFAVSCQLRHACGLATDEGQSPEQIIDFRKNHLSKTLSLSYQQPLKIVRGQGAYLYDQNGQGYLDMVNNVCHVGHCHPKVVAAGQSQMAKLNTNTRFLHDNLVNYADRLLVTMPDELSVCMFVNSGSEANELAMRLAQCFTGSKELITVDGAYHGNTAACIAASPYKFNGPGGEGPNANVHTVMLPDPYRGKFDSAQGYVDNVTEVLSSVIRKGKKPGAFICESLQGVAGQIIMPDGYLQAVYPKIREAGGVCIADEVQVGFGRVGTHMWAFETQNVVPDIITLGKPIGNGHPMAAVITTRAIADAFVTGMEYFNTFGGNPVSCAIGLAVLDAIEKQNLQQNALETGGYLLEQLRDLQQEFELIGDVRGKGLFIGVELVDDRVSKTPATEKAAQLVEFVKTQNILLSSDGPFANVLKIKPPIVFNRDDADKFVAALKLGFEFLRD